MGNDEEKETREEDDEDDDDYYEDKSHNRCLLPTPQSLCRAAIPRYQYSLFERICKPFIWGGCSEPEKENNFATLVECESTCSLNSKTCKLPPHNGHEKLATRYHIPRQPRWYSQNGQCYQFIYEGVGGNMNNFPSYKKCMKACSGSPPADADKRQTESSTTKPCLLDRACGGRRHVFNGFEDGDHDLKNHKNKTNTYKSPSKKQKKSSLDKNEKSDKSTDLDMNGQYDDDKTALVPSEIDKTIKTSEKKLATKQDHGEQS